MNADDARKLLGGYATGTLTAAEQEALFAAALEDQELFDALMKEEPLREVLQDPGSKAQLLAALETPARRSAWWNWRPLIGAVAMAGIALAVIAIWRREPAQRAMPVIVAEAPAADAQPAARNLAIEPQATPVPPRVPARNEPTPKSDSKASVESRGERVAEIDAAKTEAARPDKAAEPADVTMFPSSTYNASGSIAMAGKRACRSSR